MEWEAALQINTHNRDAGYDELENQTKDTLDRGGGNAKSYFG